MTWRKKSHLGTPQNRAVSGPPPSLPSWCWPSKRGRTRDARARAAYHGTGDRTGTALRPSDRRQTIGLLAEPLIFTNQKNGRGECGKVRRAQEGQLRRRRPRRCPSEAGHQEGRREGHQGDQEDSPSYSALHSLLPPQIVVLLLHFDRWRTSTHALGYDARVCTCCRGAVLELEAQAPPTLC